MIKATIILGEQAVGHYNETGDVPNEQWLMDNGGIVDDKKFRTKENTTPMCRPFPTRTAGAPTMSSNGTKHRTTALSAANGRSPSKINNRPSIVPTADGRS